MLHGTDLTQDRKLVSAKRSLHCICNIALLKVSGQLHIDMTITKLAENDTDFTFIRQL